jgi:glycosyltransferase involved in cell wall biosynthesis
LLFVGRLNEQKAPDGFVRLIWKLRASGLPVQGFLCGQGPLEAELRALIDGGPGGVSLLGLRDDIPRLLGAADLFVSTSRNEGLPLNVMEAMAAGTPFCAPELAQISELCRQDDDLAACLYPVPPPTGEPAEDLITAWAEHVARWLADPERRARCGRAGRQIILNRFSLERMVQRHEELYEALLNGRR